MNWAVLIGRLAEAANVLPFPPAKRLLAADNDDDPNGGGATAIRAKTAMGLIRTQARGGLAV